MNMKHQNTLAGTNQQGAALVVGLLMLVVITVLAVSGMNTATTELAMARNDQNYENAFQAAEAGLDQALAQGGYTTTTNTSLNYSTSPHDEAVATVVFEESTPFVPNDSFSFGSASAYHFLATSSAESLRDIGGETDRDSRAIHTQAFYKVGPASPTL